MFQCVCGEGFTPLPDEDGECEQCPLGTHRPFLTPDDGSPAVLADSCISCPEGTYGDPEALVPTCTLCPKNTYSDKVRGACVRGAVDCRCSIDEKENDQQLFSCFTHIIL